jgi:glycosyltransferase involved in cell wall biosynthesis
VLLLEGLQARGHQVHLYCNFEAVAEKARARGVEASIAVLGGHLALWQAPAFARRLRAFAPDALLISTFKKIWLGGRAGRMAAVPRVVSRIGLDTDLPGKHWTYRLAFRRWIDAALVNADGIRRDVLQGLPDYPADRVATVYDGVDLAPSDVSPAEARAGFGLPADAPVIGAVARLSRQKRVDRMLDMLPLLPGVHLAVAGTGELEAELRGRARTLGVDDRAHFLGFRDDVARVLAALDVFLITSDREGMANAMLEAMAVGVPVVSTPVSGAEEALGADRQGRAPGLVVQPRVETLAHAVRGILDVPAARLAMADEGRRRARERFSFEGMLDAWEAVLAGESPSERHQGR